MGYVKYLFATPIIGTNLHSERINFLRAKKTESSL